MFGPRPGDKVPSPEKPKEPEVIEGLISLTSDTKQKTAHILPCSINRGAKCATEEYFDPHLQTITNEETGKSHLIGRLRGRKMCGDEVKFDGTHGGLEGRALVYGPSGSTEPIAEIEYFFR